MARPTKKPNGYWTFERCAEEALKYDTREAFNTGSKAGYSAAQKSGWLDACCAHMERLPYRPRGCWTLERCAEEALKYDTRTAFNTGSKAGYSAAQKSGWLDACCAHMERLRQPKGYWTPERCAEKALKYDTRTAFETGSRGAYAAAKKNGWLEEVCWRMNAAPNGFDSTKPGILYYVAFDLRWRDSLYKIGITNRNASARFASEDLAPRIIQERLFPNGADAARLETQIKRKYRRHRYDGPPLLRSGGDTELFVKDVLRLDAQPR